MAETPEPAAVQEEAPLAMAEEASLEPPLPLPLAAGGILERHFRFNTPTEESLLFTRCSLHFGHSMGVDPRRWIGATEFVP